MKILQIIIGLLVLVILGISGFIVYQMLQFYFIYADNWNNGMSLPITNEFYILLISSIVLLILSLPTLLYQVQKIFRKTSAPPITDDLIDDGDLEIKPKTAHNKFLYGSTKLYAFALLTQVILMGKRFNGSYNQLASLTHWLLLGGFMLGAFVAIYFLTVDKPAD